MDAAGMTSDPLAAFLSSLGTVGPVGLTALGGWWLYLRMGSPPLLPEGGRATAVAGMHIENRDRLRDIEAVTVRLEEGHEKMTTILTGLAETQRRTVEILERLEGRIGGRTR